MKIIDVKAYPLKTRTALVRIFTDEGVEGIGECSPMNVEVMSYFVEKSLKPLLMGKNPLDIERLWDDMYFGTHKLGTSGIQPSAISGVDIALWDIKAKVAGMPLYQLLGGAVRTTFTMYKSIGGGSEMTPEQMLAKVETAYEEGYKAVKIRMDWKYRQDINPEKDIEMFRLCREFLPSEFPLSFDANNGYSVSTAILQGRKFEDMGIYHFEEPVSPTNYAGIREVADALDVPVSAGEHEYTRWQFRDLINVARPDLVQPDVVKCCGLTEGKRIAVLAETYDMSVVPHMTQPTIGNAASLALCATLPLSNRPQEHSGTRQELDDLFEDPWELIDGQFTIPNKPGLGLTINEKALKAAVMD
ncbi:mandelate racemase/muconate lactonizing enzyme family protein [Dehalococcoides mccartyi]|nr:mandelate racemase/muconate lactonizing enzyme family protein [Dehalococcoides mccartyi]